MKVDGDIEYWEDDCVIQNDITWIDGEDLCQHLVHLILEIINSRGHNDGRREIISVFHDSQSPPPAMPFSW